MATTESTRISFEDFKNELVRRVEEARDDQTFALQCPMCTANEGWTGIKGYSETTFAPLDPDAYEGDPDPVFVTLPIVCRVCGFVAHFAVGSYR